MKMKKIILIAVLTLVVGGILLAWQDFLTGEGTKHPTITETKYFACLEKCDAKYPSKLDLTSFGGINEGVEYDVCLFSCQEKYGLSLPPIPEINLPELE